MRVTIGLIGIVLLVFVQSAYIEGLPCGLPESIANGEKQKRIGITIEGQSCFLSPALRIEYQLRCDFEAEMMPSSG